MSLPIYDAIGRAYSWQQLPRDDSGATFFGFAGLDRSTLETILQGMRDGYGNWIDADQNTRSSTFARVAWDYSAMTGASYDGIYKFCFWVYSAALKDPDIMEWLRGGNFGTVDYIVKVVSEAAGSAASSAAETVKYGVEYQGEPEKTLINRVLPFAAIIAVCILAKKIID